MEENTKQNTITLKGVEYNLKPGMKAIIIFETITDAPFGIKKSKDVLVYIYASILAGTKDTKLDFEEMLDAFDEEPEAFKAALDIVMGATAIEKVVKLSNEGGPEPKKE